MIHNPHKSKFIIFEGIDHSGKSTQFDRLQRYLAQAHPDFPVIYCKEPGEDRPSGKQIYDILHKKDSEYDIDSMEPFHMQGFYIKDRMHNYRDNIIPALQSGKHVLQDRGIPSSLSYGSKTPDEFYGFMGLHDLVFAAALVPLFWPDKVLIFDVPADVAVARQKKTSKPFDAFELEAVLSRARTNYLAFAEKYPNCVVIDGTRSEEDIFTEVKTILSPFLGI